MLPTYRHLIRKTLEEGSPVPSRYGDCVEVIGTKVSLGAGNLVARRGFNSRLAMIEMLQVVAGIYNFESIKKVAPSADLGLFSAEGAYGPRMAGQLDVVVKTLGLNPTSRQAVVFVGRPEDTCSNELPCTISMQFLIRNRWVNSVVSMRSWDLVKGLPYDVAVFGGLTMAVARTLGLSPGLVMVTAGSGHIYESDHKLIIGDSLQPFGNDFEFGQEVPRNWQGIREWAHDRVHESLAVDDNSWMRDIRIKTGGD
jgi:thymidylate synthase